MYRMIFTGLITSLGVIVFTGIVGAQQEGAKFDSKGDTQTYLGIAVEEQKVEIALGELAAQRAKNEQVKEFGSKMVDTHKKVRREAEQLASRHSIPLPLKLTPEDKKKVDELSQLSGHEFDRTYITREGR